MDVTRLDESDNYRAQRAELLQAELELMRQREKVAALRRDLPLETKISDYEFDELDPSLDGTTNTVKLSDLFTAPDRTLVIYHFMYGKKQTDPCPMCTMWIDGFNAIAQHLAQRVDFAIVAAPPAEKLAHHAFSRGWTNLRLLVDKETFKYDHASEDSDGNQDSTVSVFRRDSDGNIKHFYSAHPMFNENEWRGVDLLAPVWHVLDLTPEGRGDWFPQVTYG